MWKSEAELIDYREASKLLGLPVRNLYTLVFNKVLPHYRLTGRTVKFDREELTRWIRERYVPGE